MRTRTNSKVSTFDGIDETDRDMELENIIGNLMIAQYQVEKLRSRLAERVGGYGSASNKKASVFLYNHNDKKYGIRLDVNEIGFSNTEPSKELEKLREQHVKLQSEYRELCRHDDALFDKLNIARDRVVLLTKKCHDAGVSLEPFELKLITA